MICIIVENSRISDLSCFQHTAGERKVSCFWYAEPPGVFFEVLVTKHDGIELFRKNVSENVASLEFDDGVGNEIIISVRHVSTRVDLRGTLVERYTHGGHCFRRFGRKGSLS